MRRTGEIKTSFHYSRFDRKWGLFVWAMLLLGSPVIINAQTCCSGGVPLGGSLGLGIAKKKALEVLVTYDYNAINDLISFTNKLDDKTRNRTTQSSLIELNYGLSHRFSFTGVIPFIRQTRTIQAYNNIEDITITQGLGDILFLIKYRLIHPEEISEIDWVVGAGPKIPTARTNYTNNQELMLPADMQPGSGSLDGILWSYFLKNRFLKNPNLGLVAFSSLRYSGENKNYNTSQTYRFGNEFQFSMGMNYNFFVKWPVNIFTFMRYRFQDEDLIDKGVFPSSGGEWVYVIPGMNINFTPHITTRISGDIPVYRKLEGTQLTTSYKLTFALQFNIPFNKNELFIH